MPSDYVDGYEAIMEELATTSESAAFEAAVSAGSTLAIWSILSEALCYLDGIVTPPSPDPARATGVVVDIGSRIGANPEAD